MLWDLNEGKHLYSLEAGDIVNALVFSPNRYWLCAATAAGIKIFDLESKSIVDDLRPESADGNQKIECTSLAWSADGQTLYAGFTDNVVRVWTVVRPLVLLSLSRLPMLTPSSPPPAPLQV